MFERNFSNSCDLETNFFCWDKTSILNCDVGLQCSTKLKCKSKCFLTCLFQSVAVCFTPSEDVSSRSLNMITFNLIIFTLFTVNNCLISHSLYDLTPAPYLVKQLPYNKYKYSHGSDLRKGNNVYRDFKENLVNYHSTKH